MSFLFLLALLPAHADRYVSTTGSDVGNSCTDVAVPCATLEHALTSSSSGDSVFVGAGTYSSTASAYPMTVPAGVSVIGDGAAFTRLTSTAYTLLYVAPTTEPMLLQDLTISGSEVAVQSTDAAALRLQDVNVEDASFGLVALGYVEAVGTIDGGTFSNVDTVVAVAGSAAGASLTLDGVTATGGYTLIDVAGSGAVDVQIRDTVAIELDMLGYVRAYSDRLDLSIEDSEIGTVVAYGAADEPHSVHLSNVVGGPFGTGVFELGDQAEIELAGVSADDWSWDLYASEVHISDSTLAGDSMANLFLLRTPGVSMIVERSSITSDPTAINMLDGGDLRLFETDITGSIQVDATTDVTVVFDDVTMVGELQLEPTVGALDLRMVDVDLSGGTLSVYSNDAAASVLSIQDSVFHSSSDELHFELPQYDVELDGVEIRDRGFATIDMLGDYGRVRVVNSALVDNWGGWSFTGDVQERVEVSHNLFAGHTGGGWIFAPRSPLPPEISIDLNAFEAAPGGVEDLFLLVGPGVIPMGRLWLTSDDPVVAEDHIAHDTDPPVNGPFRTGEFTLLSHTLQPVMHTQYVSDQGGPVWLSTAPGTPPFVQRSGQQLLTVEVGGQLATDVVVSADGSTLTAVVPPLPAGTVDITVRNPIGHAGTTTVEVLPGLPNELGLTLGPLVIGQDSVATITGAPPRAPIAVAIAANVPGAAVCPAVFAGACSVLPGQLGLLLQGRADADGTLSLPLRVPNSPPADGMVAQAFLLRNGVASPGVTAPWLEPDEDADGDGLDNLGELLAGSDALAPDTDGDRCKDGVDLAPTVPSMDADRNGYPDDCPRF